MELCEISENFQEKHCVQLLRFCKILLTKNLDVYPLSNDYNLPGFYKFNFNRSNKMKIMMPASIMGMLLSSVVFADDLKINNTTDKTFTFSINQHCSEQIGKVAPHSTTIISAKNLGGACDYNTIRCISNIYPNNNCTGNSVAQVMFDLRIGVRGVDNYHKGYAFSTSLFTLNIKPEEKHK